MPAASFGVPIAHLVNEGPALILRAGSDSLVALSYFCIAALLSVFIWSRPLLRRLGWSISTFFVAWGLIHVMDAWTIWRPDYWASPALRTIAAFASLCSVAAFLPLVPAARILRRFGGLGELNVITAATEQRPGPDALGESERQLRVVVEAMPYAVFTANAQGLADYGNRAWYSYTGRNEETQAGSWASVVHAQDAQRCLAGWNEAVKNGEPFETQIRLRRASDGMYRWFDSRATPVVDPTGAIVKWIGSHCDIHDLKVAVETRDVLDALGHIISIRDEDGCLEYTSPSWAQYTGTGADHQARSDWREFIHPDDAAVLEREDHGYAASSSTVQANEVRLRAADGEYRWFLARTVVLTDTQGAPTRRLDTLTDIDDLRQAEPQVAEASLASTNAPAELEAGADSPLELTGMHHDALNSFPNRIKLIDHLALMIAEGERDGTDVVVLYLDVDHFKSLNDSLGHNTGDKVLLEIAARINSTLRAGDTASRFGSDEFVLVCAAADRDIATRIAERVQAAVRAPVELDGKRAIVASSIGISVFPYDGSEAADLIQKAEAAMYAAKHGGGNAWCLYSAQTRRPEVPALEFELQLRQAIALKEFVVYYQPIINVETGHPVGAEALVRWEHPERGLLAPSEFISFAESHGLIVPIGELVLHAACAQLQRLSLRAGDDFSIAVNVSARQFQQPDFVATIATTIAAHEIDPSRLEIEITESGVMGDTTAVIETLDELRALGVKLAIDDFGTGYSSLAYIKNFPIQTLKIDRSFVAEIALNFTDQAIAKTIVTLGHSLGMRVVAEGVETLEQLERLRSFGADCIQGYLFSRPLASAEFEDFLAGRRSNAILGRLGGIAHRIGQIDGNRTRRTTR